MNEQDTELALNLLLDRAWTPIATAGWNRYQLYGRGALLASMKMLEGQSSEMDFITPGPETQLPEWLEAPIAAYDPTKSVVLVFVGDDVFRGATRQSGPTLVSANLALLRGPAFVKTVERTPTPPQCAKDTAH